MSGGRGWAVPNTPVVRLQTDSLSANTDNKLQALVYDILSPTTAISDYDIHPPTIAITDYDILSPTPAISDYDIDQKQNKLHKKLKLSANEKFFVFV